MNINVLIEKYSAGYSLSELGRLFGHCASTIKKELINNGVKIRSQKEQNVFTNKKRKKPVDEEYFSNIDTPQKAWLMGFIASDGTISKKDNTIKIGLSAVDKEILEKINIEIKNNRKIYETQTNSGFFIAETRWSSQQQKEDLKRFGITPNKTYKPMQIPEIDEKLKLAFILGYFDGDGSFSVDKTGRYCRFRICAYRAEILQSIANYLSKKYNSTYSFNKSHIYELSFSTTAAIKILQDAYNLCPLRLDRKYKKFLEFKNHETTTSDIDEKIC